MLYTMLKPPPPQPTAPPQPAGELPPPGDPPVPPLALDATLISSRTPLDARIRPLTRAPRPPHTSPQNVFAVPPPLPPTANSCKPTTPAGTMKVGELPCAAYVQVTVWPACLHPAWSA